MELILVRHPRPEIAPDTCYGRSDIPAAVTALGEGLASLAPQLVPAIARGYRLYSSPLRRCTALATMLGDFTPDPRLQEMDFGDWELRTWPEIPRCDIDAWAADLLDYRPGGGETVREVAGRVQSFLDDLRHDAIIVCHAGTMRLMAAMAAGEPLLQAAARANQIKYCQTLCLSWPAKPV